jgi:NADPH:quinone reductase-like Zn-dependent oxidoreductase
MKAVVIDQFGNPENLQLRELPDLLPEPGMLTIDVAYAGVGYVDIMFRKGAFGTNFPMPLIPGLEVAGYVREIGEGVEGFYIGQPVVSMTLMNLGGYASIAHASPDLTVPLDQLGADLSLDAAAASIVNLTTAYMAIKHVNKMQVNDTIVVHGAVGGLGSFLGQVAKKLGAGKVFGTVGSAEKMKRAASLGYDELFLRSDFKKQVLQATEQKGVHTVFDPVGGEIREQSLEVLHPLGQLIVVGNASGKEDVPFSSNQLWKSNKSVSGFALGSYAQTAPQIVGKAAKEALQMLAKKEIHAEIFGVFPLDEVIDAHLLLEEKNTVGKLLLRIENE